LLDDLSEPPGEADADAQVHLGATQAFEEVIKVASRGQIVLNVEGNWVGRQPDQTEEDALRAIRNRAFRSGQDMRNVQLALPGATGGSTVTGPGATAGAGGAQPAGAGQPDGAAGGLFGGAATAGGEGPAGGATGTEQTTGVPAVIGRVQTAQEPQIGVNLCGQFERWGLHDGTTLKTAKVEFRGLSVQQIKQILQRLPSAFRASLEVTYDEEVQP